MTKLKNKHEAIGNIVHNHTRIEHGLTVWVTNMISDDEIIGLIVASEMSFKNLISATLALLKYKEKSERLIKENFESLLNLIKQISLVEQQRNIYAHSMILDYTYDENDEFYNEANLSFLKIKISAKQRGFNLDMTELNLNDFEKIINEQDDILKEMHRLSIICKFNKRFDMNKLKSV